MDLPTIHNGIYTITSPKGGHRTFQIKTALNGALKGSRILSMLTGPDNTRNYTGFAFVNNDGIKVWSKYAVNPDYKTYGELLWSLALDGERSPYFQRGYRLLVEGRCVKCNRRLTVPESVISGIGPECAGRSH